MGLDEARVVPELIAQLEAAAANLCDRWGGFDPNITCVTGGGGITLFPQLHVSSQGHTLSSFYFLCRSMDAHLDGLVETMDALQPDDLLACLDVMGEGATEGAGAAAGAEAVPKS